jgi:hypothetical protein
LSANTTVRLCKVPSLDLYREPDPFRVPWPGEIRDGIDLLELATMWTAGFPEPRTFTLRAARVLSERAGEFDVVHDNQSLCRACCASPQPGFRWWPPCTIPSPATGFSTWPQRGGGVSRWCTADMASPRSSGGSRGASRTC